MNQKFRKFVKFLTVSCKEGVYLVRRRGKVKVYECFASLLKQALNGGNSRTLFSRFRELGDFGSSGRIGSGWEFGFEGRTSLRQLDRADGDSAFYNGSAASQVFRHFHLTVDQMLTLSIRC